MATQEPVVMIDDKEIKVESQVKHNKKMESK